MRTFCQTRSFVSNMPAEMVVLILDEISFLQFTQIILHTVFSHQQVLLVVFFIPNSYYPTLTGSF